MKPIELRPTIIDSFIGPACSPQAEALVRANCAQLMVRGEAA